MSLRWPLGIITGSLGVVAVVAFSADPVRIAVTNVWDNAAIVREQEPTRLIFVGDIMLSRSVGDAMAQWGDWARPFTLVAPTLAKADLTFGNLESVISDKGAKSGCTYCFRADPLSLKGLMDSGFDVLSVANNHAWDYGIEAFTDSMKLLEIAGIAPVGGGLDSSKSRQPVIRDAGDARVAYLAYTDMVPASSCASDTQAGVSCYDAASMAQDIAAANSVADIVVVSFHTGDEYEPHNARQEKIYRAAIDAGADLVVGHHPHVVQDIERYGNGWIAYSLGNFIFDQTWSPETMRGMVLDVKVENDAIAAVATRSVDISRQYQASIGEN